MRHMPGPIVNDVVILGAIQAEIFAGQPNQQVLHQTLLAQYQAYATHHGDPFLVTPAQLPADVQARLKKKYKSRAHAFLYIVQIRKHLSPDLCPMCGSLASSTVDHYLPKDDFPEYSIFSLNLVPACNCNIARNNTFIGTVAGERPLHPYFDAVLSTRLISLLVIPNGNSYAQARLDLSVVVPAGHPQLAAITFHVDKVVRRTNILAFMEKKWERMLHAPDAFFDFAWQRGANKSQQDFNQLIAQLRLANDIKYQTPNNWFSIFFHGIEMDPAASNYIYTQIL